MENLPKKRLIELYLETQDSLDTAVISLNKIKQDFKELKMLYNTLLSENKSLKAQLESSNTIKDSIITEKNRATTIAKAFGFAFKELIGD